ncbi:DUF1822 family protein [Anabaena cylindrica FACHB-243]|uniref:DUF1822 family protein n=1 Tax=Anabaena cylindrica (strain ATCC 27899 / PCC 7122) TaxID=272123 RepID=K9ZAM3_ANACC|nr:MULTISPECIES: DUF1822 family protein [Anabaena]AFZ55779.1 protein of unknown function DUF1822 [Anabaena cylindrica PCC 7122]MBD2420220.1 DUF1822 family protein [Anabaena cylindrica FACHB-243]MBY5283091.1 DUF1822 family protein [Anabaena sp. CCAP 1446/1C]MBY5307808.1 DUF1822 family protein [Anabaena sp. CCAP 1446/1C]MCM2406128.1 DUF1822 family protein [Anabaena sp. CCAP 1446/1C]
MSLFCVPPTQLYLEVSLEVQNQSWQQSQSFVSPLGRWNAFLNQVCLSTFLPWLQTEYAPEATVETLPQIWEVVSGTAINLDTKRLILIPDKNLETREFNVPQEWIDIPKLAGDYYLAVQVNPDGQWMQIWGYTTHEQLKNQGSYDPQERTYSLEANQMIEDLNVLWVVRQLYPEEQTQTAIPPLPVLSATQAENLKQRLASPTITNPRLELPFEIWGALLESEDFLQPTQNTTIINLRQWFENVVTNSWQTIESLFGTEANLAFSFRQANNVAEELIQRVKVINLPIQNANQALVLMLTLTAETDGRLGIRAQLYPNNRNSYLPNNVRLALISASGDVVQSVTAREADNSIQLKRFRCPLNTRFSLQVILDDFSFMEEFEC